MEPRSTDRISRMLEALRNDILNYTGYTLTVDQILEEEGVYETPCNGKVFVFAKSLGASAVLYAKRNGEVVPFQPNVWKKEKFKRVPQTLLIKFESF